MGEINPRVYEQDIASQQKDIEKIEAENVELRRVMAWYGDEKNHYRTCEENYSQAMIDEGRRARDAIAILDQKKPERPCEIKWCKSGLSVAIHVEENMDDGCWRIGICQLCADAIGIIEGQEMPDARLVKAMIGAGK